VEPTANGSGRSVVSEFFHYSNNGQYKKLSVEIFKDGGIALVLKQGEKGKPSDGIVFSLSRAEAIHLMEELKLLFHRGV
jgi:predicted ATPase